MPWWRAPVTVAVVLAFAGALGGCAADPRRAPPPDAWIDRAPGPPEIFTYVISGYDLPTMEPAPGLPTVGPGFDLDGKTSVENGPGTCEDTRADFVSIRREPGVDNQLFSLSGYLDFAFGGHFAHSVSAFVEERRVVAIRVRDVNDPLEDPEVSVDVVVVEPTSCADGRCTRGPRPGDEWLEVEPVANRIPAAIENERLRVALGDREIVFQPAPIAGMPRSSMSLTLHDAILSAVVGPDQLDEATLGGSISVGQVVEAGEQRNPGTAEIARALLQDFADLRPSPTDPAACEMISAGFWFEVVGGQVIRD